MKSHSFRYCIFVKKLKVPFPTEVRIVSLRSGSKTGGIPSKTDFEAGLSPQLPLEAAIAEAGGFEGVPGDRIGDLAYWQLTGKAGTPGKIRIVSADGTELGAEARTGLEQLIAGFDDPAQPYLSQPQAAARPRFSDYDHLARRAEWASESGDGT